MTLHPVQRGPSLYNVNAVQDSLLPPQLENKFILISIQLSALM